MMRRKVPSILAFLENLIETVEIIYEGNSSNIAS